MQMSTLSYWFLKPIHATWLVEMYNFLTSVQGRVYVLKGWEEAVIKGVITGREILPPVDPHQDIYTNGLCTPNDNAEHIAERTEVTFRRHL